MRDSQPAGAPVTIGIVAGEASGDALAATLIRAVRERLPQVRFVGIAGPKMQAAGCDAWYPLETLAVRGFVEVVGHLPELVRIRGALARRLVAERVPVFVGVDAPDFNLGLERRLKRRGVRTVHFVSPSVWAWRPERVAKIGRAVDRMLALFPFEPPVYEAAGVPVTFVGHPLAQAAARHGSRRETRGELRLGAAEPVFALLPGSRASELEMHGDLVLRTAAAIHDAKPDARFLVPLATRPTRDRFEAAIYRLGLEKLPLTLLYGHAGDALRAADVALVASGTATLEAALARCPHVIFYRVTPFTYRDRAAQAAAAVGRPAQRPRAALRRARAAAGRRHRREPRAGGAQPLRRHRDAAPAGGAVRGLRRGADRGHRRTRGGGRRGGAARGRRRVLIAGVDEAGRGPLAGPVVAAAVILDPARPVAGLRDSKLLTAAARERLAGEIRASALAWCVAHADVAEIDALNILRGDAARRCAARSRASRSRPARCWSTATAARGSRCAVRAIVGGDRSVPAISAASILAKTARDAQLVELDARHPGYGFARNKGYGTPEHLAALGRLGPCAVHRRSFAPVAQSVLDF